LPWHSALLNTAVSGVVPGDAVVGEGGPVNRLVLSLVAHHHHILCFVMFGGMFCSTAWMIASRALPACMLQPLGVRERWRWGVRDLVNLPLTVVPWSEL